MKHSRCLCLFQKNFMSKQRIPPFLNFPPFSPTLHFLEKIFHPRPYYQTWGSQSYPLCHQVTVSPNWSLISLSKLPYLLGVLWPIIVPPDHIPVFPNELDSEAGIVPFVIMLYLFRVCSQWCMYFMFLLYFLIFICFCNQFDRYDIFSSTVGLQIIFNWY